MKFSIEFTQEQFEFLSELLSDAVQFYEHQAAAFALLDDEAACNLAQECLDSAWNAAELAWLLALYQADHGSKRSGIIPRILAQNKVNRPIQAKKGTEDHENL